MVTQVDIAANHTVQYRREKHNEKETLQYKITCIIHCEYTPQELQVYTQIQV